jgi:hypothetical protein
LVRGLKVKMLRISFIIQKQITLAIRDEASNRKQDCFFLVYTDRIVQRNKRKWISQRRNPILKHSKCFAKWIKAHA